MPALCLSAADLSLISHCFENAARNEDDHRPGLEPVSMTLVHRTRALLNRAQPQVPVKFDAREWLVLSGCVDLGGEIDPGISNAAFARALRLVGDAGGME